jgi:hypothetical protein
LSEKDGNSELFMSKSVIVNIFNIDFSAAKRFFFLPLVIHFILSPFVFSQTQIKGSKIQGFEELLSRPVNLRPEIKNVHPRLFFTASDLPRLREKARSSADRELWQAVLNDIQTLKRNAPDAKDEDLYKSGLDERKKGSISQYEFAFQIAQTSFAYAIEGDEKYLEAAKKWTLAACAMPIWGYTYNKPNVDLPPAHLLYAVAFAYDVLFDKLTASEKEIVKNKLIKQARLMYDYFKFKKGKRYTYSQNHTWIPMAGLAIAAYALMDESAEAKDWAQLARAVFDRTMLTFAADGYFYESFHYFGFAFRWMIRYFDAHLAATGENLYEPMRSKFAQMKYFAMHSVLPDRENVFDFADVGDGALNRNGTSKREKLYGEYDILYRFAGIYSDAQAQTVGDFIRTETTLGTREPMWAFINHDSNLKPAALSLIPTQVYFPDNDTAFWRSDWSKNATAFAFRCAPPEGHTAAKLAGQIPDWRENTGHAHPDANSFIIFSGGKYLTGDTGYLGIKNTDDHNTILVNNRGQEKDGIYEMFKEVSNERLDKIRIAETWGNADYFYARGEAASGYYADLGLKKFDRNFLYVAPDYFIVWDELETEKTSDFTFLLNADREIKLGGNEAELINKDAALRVVRIAPAEAKSIIIPQMIQARGLPGSVDKGDLEQRGVQLQTVSAEKQTNFEFLHFLQPFLMAESKNLPQVSALPNGEKGLQIVWTNGDKELVLLNGKGANIESNSERLVFRRDKTGGWKRLIFQNSNSVKIDEAQIFQSSEKFSASFQITGLNTLRGNAESSKNTQVKLVIPILPKAIKINGRTIKFTFEKSSKTLSFELPAGKSLIESE